jgi:hypothetical protein
MRISNVQRKPSKGPPTSKLYSDSNTAFELDRTFEHPRWRDGLGRDGRQTRDFKLTLFVAEAALQLVRRHRVGAGRFGEPIDRRDLVDGWQVDHHLTGSAQVLGRL